SCSVSSGQYYVSDDCSSVTQSPCNPLLVYAGDMSQYNNTIFYFIGTSSIRNYDAIMTAIKNVTLHGLDQSPSINCKGVFKTSISIHSSNNITISNSSFFRSKYGKIHFYNAFDVNISSSVYNGYQLVIWYNPLPVCSDELPHYSLILANVNLTQLLDVGGMELEINHGNSYNVSIIFDHLHSAQWPLMLELFESICNFFIIKSSFDNANQSVSFSIKFGENSTPTKCSYPGITLVSNVVLIEESQFYNNWHGFEITTDQYLPGTMNYHIIIKS
uniref:Uncharacterized protein n=1 Tax=Amphimedon queenslandica TaxID=400682 RepID=A0A1X7TS56_AMPQE